jgi:Bacterial protein of unknown function (DUF899)
MNEKLRDELGAPKIVDRSTFGAELDALRIREKAHTHEGDAVAAARRRLSMVEMDPGIPLVGPNGPVPLLDTFESREQLIAYYFMWHIGHPAPEQCEGCTWGYIADARAVLYSFAGCHLCRVLPRPLRRECPVPGLHGVGDAMVFGTRLASNSPGGAPDRQDAHRLLFETRIQSLRDVLGDGARRRGD